MINVQVSNSKIISKGTQVGGLVGLASYIFSSFAYNNIVEGYSYVGGIAGLLNYSTIEYTYNNSDVKAIEHSAGGILGFLKNGLMDNINSKSSIRFNYYVGKTIIAKSNVGGIIGEIETELYNKDQNYYYSNYVETNIIGEDNNAISLGVGNILKENQKLAHTYYYKYSTINGIYPNEKNEPYIESDKYLVNNDLKQVDTYKNKLRWSANFYDYTILEQNKYPLLKFENKILKNQEGIELPIDPITEEQGNREDANSEFSDNADKELQYTFNYNGKIIKTYETYSEIIAEDGSKVVRKDVRLYIKDGKLYALPASLKFGGNVLKLVANNFVIDSYNGKEYETVLGTDGKIYDLKEPLKYPENFVNNGIKSIGNNLDYVRTDNESSNKEENLHEVEVIYINGGKLKFNYQTGEVISSIEEKQGKTGLFDYMKEKISELGNLNSGELQEITTKYKESKILQNKIEQMPVEYALKEQSNNTNKIEDIKNGENDKANNSLKETRYISIYNAEKNDYYIYQEEELLDTTKQEVVSENDKIEANNLKEYYVSEGKSRNKNMGILWITLSIVGVVIILFAIKKRD